MENHKSIDAQNRADSDAEMMNRRNRQRGWAMLGLILALAVMAIMLASVTPNVRTQVQREKEAEMIFRGGQMALGIARYYNNGAPFPRTINLQTPPRYGYLTELKKLAEGLQIGPQEVRFVRQSAMIEPLSNMEWEPVRLRDPRLLPALDAYAAYYKITIPEEYRLLAAPPPASPFGDEDDDDDSPLSNTNRSGGNPTNSNVRREEPVDPDDDEDDDDDDEDDDDEDDDDEDTDTDATTPGSTTPRIDGSTEKKTDPFASIFENGKSNLPIVAVAPRLKGRAIKPLWGTLKNYEEWVFIFLPKNGVFLPPGGGGSNPGAGNTNRPRISR